MTDISSALALDSTALELWKGIVILGQKLLPLDQKTLDPRLSYLSLIRVRKWNE